MCQPCHTTTSPGGRLVQGSIPWVSNVCPEGRPVSAIMKTAYIEDVLDDRIGADSYNLVSARTYCAVNVDPEKQSLTEAVLGQMFDNVEYCGTKEDTVTGENFTRFRVYENDKKEEIEE